MISIQQIKERKQLEEGGEVFCEFYFQVHFKVLNIYLEALVTLHMFSNEILRPSYSFSYN